MTATVSIYNHTSKLFLEGSINPTETFKVMMCTASTFDATDTTLAGVTKTEVAGGNGYTTGGDSLTGVTVTTVSTNGAKFDADDLSYTAVSGTLSANSAILYVSSLVDEPPLALIDFGETVTDQVISFIWNTDGIFQITVSTPVPVPVPVP